MNWTYVYYLHLDTLASPTKRFKGLRNLFTTSFQTRYDFGCRKCNRIRLCFPKVFYFNCSLYRTREGELVPCDNFFLICYQFMSTKKMRTYLVSMSWNQLNFNHLQLVKWSSTTWNLILFQFLPPQWNIFRWSWLMFMTIYHTRFF